MLSKTLHLAIVTFCLCLLAAIAEADVHPQYCQHKRYFEMMDELTEIFKNNELDKESLDALANRYPSCLDEIHSGYCMLIGELGKEIFGRMYKMTAAQALAKDREARLGISYCNRLIASTRNNMVALENHDDPRQKAAYLTGYQIILKQQLLNRAYGYTILREHDRAIRDFSAAKEIELKAGHTEKAAQIDKIIKEIQAMK